MRTGQRQVALLPRAGRNPRQETHRSGPARRAPLPSVRRCGRVQRGRGSAAACPAAISSGSIQGVTSSIVASSLSYSAARAGSAAGVGVAAGRRGSTSFAISRMPFSASVMVEKAGAADKDEMAEPADLLVNVHDLFVDGIRVAGAQDAAGDRLLGSDADQALARPHIGLAARPRRGPVVLRSDLGRHAPRQKFRHLRRLLEAGVEKPQGLAADPQTLLVGVADIAQSGIGETVGAGRRQPGLAARIAIGVEGALAGLGAAQHERVDHAAPAELGRGLGIAGRRPHRRVRPLVDRRPDVDVAVGEVLALPAERPVMRGQRLLDQVDRLPEALDIADRVGVARHHLAVARFDKADLEPAARDDVGRRVFLGDPHRIGADRDQGPERQDADLLGLPGEDAEDHRARAVEAVDPGMVLDRDDVDARARRTAGARRGTPRTDRRRSSGRNICWAGWRAPTPRWSSMSCGTNG